MSKKRTNKQKRRAKNSGGRRAKQRRRGNAHDPCSGLLHQAEACHQQGRLAEAEQLYRSILAQAPEHADALHLYGVLCYQGKAYAQAVDLIRRAVRLNPGEAAMHANLGAALHEAGDYAGAERELCQALESQPDCPGAHYNLGRALAAQNKLEQAAKCYHLALQINPDDWEALNNLGNVLQKQGRLQEAVNNFRKSLKINPGYARAHSNLANALRECGEYRAAAESAGKAVRLNPDFSEAWLNLANACADLGMTHDAITGYQRALQINPEMISAMINLGAIYVDNYQYAQAIRLLERLITLQPENASGLGSLVHYRKYLADWTDLDKLTNEIKRLVMEHGQSMIPFGFLGLSTSPAEQLACIRNYSRKMTAGFAAGSASELSVPVHHSPEKLRVGFLSSDFRRHVVAFLIADLVEELDREEFTVTAYSYGRDDGSAERRRLMQAFDEFVDIRENSLEETLKRIRQERIDILIDLKGHTHNSRIAISASRPAPIQVRWLGHAGTMGMNAYDYLIADGFVTPASVQPYYTEKLVRLPDCYQVCVRRSGNRPMSRADFGLPDAGVILCCFNTVYKITPPVFDVWMRVLQKIPDAVLWLLVEDDIARNNLRQAARAKGVDPQRLIFAPFMEHEEHLLRYQAADIFLDTFEISACATSGDALWGGCPVVTCAGETFASRAAGSMLRAVGLEELITFDLAEYEAMILDLARNPMRLAELRRRLTDARRTAPLFDCKRFTRNFSAALRRMREIHSSGKPPQSFNVEE